MVATQNDSITDPSAATNATIARWLSYALVIWGGFSVSGCQDTGPWTPETLRAQDTEGMTLLHRAALVGHGRTITAALEQGADFHAKDRCERTPLHWAAIAGHAQVAKRLIGAGANVEIGAWFDLRPLHWASLLGNAKVVEVLVASGAEIEAPDFYGRTALHLAADAPTMKTLLGFGARVDAVDHHGMTPLHLVRSEGGAKALMIAGADAMVRARDGRRPVDMVTAANDGPPEVLLLPSRSYIRLRGETTELEVTVASTTATALPELNLAASSHAAEFVVRPALMEQLEPGQVKRFRIVAKRLQGVPEAEHTATLVLGQGQRPLASFELRIDNRREETPEDRGMTRLGNIKIEAAPGKLHYIAYGSTPLLLLVLWLLTTRRKKEAENVERT